MQQKFQIEQPKEKIKRITETLCILRDFKLYLLILLRKKTIKQWKINTNGLKAHS